jgi:hypothetical protein
MMRITRSAAAAAVGLLALLAASPVRANPTTADPTAPFTVYPDSENQRLLAELQKLEAVVRAELARWKKSSDSDQLRQIKPPDIGKAYVETTRMLRLADRLRLRGETAGVDYAYRAERLRAEINRVVDAYRLLPNVNVQIVQHLQAVDGISRKRQLELPKIGELAKKEDWIKAEEGMHSILDEMNLYSIWYNQQQREIFFQPFSAALVLVEGKAREVRHAEAQQHLTALRNEAAPNFTAPIAELHEAATALANSPRVEIDGQMFSGPQVVVRITDAWRRVHAATLRCRGLDWTRGLHTGRVPPSDLDKLEEDYARFSRDVPAAVGTLIAADAKRANPLEVKELYTAYLTAVAALASLAPDEVVVNATETSLAQLAAKAPPVQYATADYRRATDDYLRWRQRAAESFATARQEDFPHVGGIALRGFRAEGRDRRLVPEDANELSRARLLVPASTVLEGAAPKVVGANVHVVAVAGISDSPDLALSRYLQRVYVGVPLPPAQARHAAQLKAALAVSDAWPPLSLPAAIAIASAERGDLHRAAGSISAAALEPLATRMATLTPGEAAISPLGRLPIEPNEMVPVEEVIVRISIEPAWLQHRYFFFEVGP